MAECIVHFEVHDRSGEVSKLRGLIMNDGGKPTVEDVQEMLGFMGYPVKVEDDERYTYLPSAAGSEWVKIVVKKLDTGEEEFTPDTHLKALAESMMSARSSRPI